MGSSKYSVRKGTNLNPRECSFKLGNPEWAPLSPQFLSMKFERFKLAQKFPNSKYYCSWTMCRQLPVLTTVQIKHLWAQDKWQRPEQSKGDIPCPMPRSYYFCFPKRKMNKIIKISWSPRLISLIKSKQWWPEIWLCGRWLQSPRLGVIKSRHSGTHLQSQHLGSGDGKKNQFKNSSGQRGRPCGEWNQEREHLNHKWRDDNKEKGRIMHCIP